MNRPMRGMSFVDVIVGTALVLIIFLALFGLLRASVSVAQLTKAKAIATAVADSQIEYVRSLSYSSVGTVGGIPAGTVPQYSTTTSNGTAYGVRTFIAYEDDPGDGLAGADTNGIITDYKRIKVTVTYIAGGRSRTVDMISNYSPLGMETSTGGGTLRLVIVNAISAPLSGASVRIVNASTSPTVDLTTFSDVDGIVYLPGAATSTQYQVYVSKSGYSSAQTYLRDATNQNPTPGYLTVTKDMTTTSTFAIDILSHLTVRTYTPVATSSYADTFSVAAGITTFTNTVLSGGSVVLSTSGPGYSPSGSVLMTPLSPPYLYAWSSASSTTVLPAGTSAVVHVADGTGTILPDAVLPGNAVGFTAPVDLSVVSTTTYPSLSLIVDLTTTDVLATPELQDWGIAYQRGPVPVPNVDFMLFGGKTIGSTGTGVSIYKTTIATTTGSGGSNTLSLEWDAYQLGVSGYDTIDACNAPPYTISPNTTSETALYLGPASTNSLLVSVRDSAGAAVSGATVILSRPGFTETVTTSACGGAYFGSITASSAYTIQSSKPGYSSTNTSGVNILGHTFYADSI
ncbi:MAG: Autotransporter adhesin [Parcubacteria bacterium C7867-008]|nr:MAG: Autotransporter adhesin [Parcubacteria bacterium C7867-008]